VQLTPPQNQLEGAITASGIDDLPRRQVRSPHGYLHLAFRFSAETAKTLLATCRQQPPLNVVRAFQMDGGEALVHLHNVSGGVLGGDNLEMSVVVGARAHAQITTTGATRIYRSRRFDVPARQSTVIDVGENALLEYLPDPLIPFARARYQQKTVLNLAPGGGLFWWETIAPGREASGELFEYDLLKIKLDITADGKPIVHERFKLEPALRPLSSPARLGPFRYFSTFYICRHGEERSNWPVLEKQLSEIAAHFSIAGETLWGVSTLPAHGLVVRALSMNGRSIESGLPYFWSAAKLALYGKAAIPPRKVH
jgi:urease accessory protein